MKKFIGLLIVAVLVAHSFALYTENAVISYKLPTGVTPQIDGMIDDVWKGISKKHSIRMDFSDMTKTVFQYGNEQDDYSTGSSPHITILSAYDNSNLYFLFIVTEEHVQKLTCTNADLWRMDAMEVWLDPSQWDPATYLSYFGMNADPGNTLGSGLHTIQAAVPIHPEEHRYQYNAFVTATGFGLKQAPANTLVGVGFKNGSDDKTVAVELRFPWWGPAASALPTDMYIAWGYNEWRTTFMGWTCSDNFPIQHRWQYDETANPGTIDPAANPDSWGKLVLSTTLAVPAATGSADVAGNFTVGPARCSAYPDDPLCTDP